ncbi:MAG: hypothetical protein QNJ29_05595 [Rhizobiaceae bacterium]|nr:hypothetical protein [Rhizobiaceae bacterium]
MAEKDLEAKDIERKFHDLAAAMREVKSAQADRDDVVVEMRHAKFSRLELLAEDLAPVFAEVPTNVEMFDFALTKGDTPRLWIDMTSFIRLGKDGRTYEFVKDTRLGRTILGNTGNREKIGRRVTDYVAERLLERERMLEGDWIYLKSQLGENSLDTPSENETNAGAIGSKDSEQENLSGQDVVVSSFRWFLFGVLMAGGVMFALHATDQLAPFSDWLAKQIAQ